MCRLCFPEKSHGGFLGARTSPGLRRLRKFTRRGKPAQRQSKPHRRVPNQNTRVVWHPLRHLKAWIIPLMLNIPLSASTAQHTHTSARHTTAGYTHNTRQMPNVCTHTNHKRRVHRSLRFLVSQHSRRHLAAASSGPYFAASWHVDWHSHIRPAHPPLPKGCGSRSVLT
jgi:hypothetical protein